MEIKLTKSDIDLSQHSNYLQNGYTLNMTIMEAYKNSDAKNAEEFFSILKKLGMNDDDTILLSEADVEDYKMIRPMFEYYGDFCHYNGPAGKETLYQTILDILCHFSYFDIPFERNGKWGLRTSAGKEVVPPIFEDSDGITALIFCNGLATVKLNGKYYFTPRDNSGRLINAEGYDNITITSHVMRNGKEGFVNPNTGKEIIPCEMDWIMFSYQDIDSVNIHHTLGKDGKIGWLETDDTLEHPFLVPPIYSAINITTHQVLLDGEWGWIQSNGQFTTKTPKFIDDTSVMPWTEVLGLYFESIDSLLSDGRYADLNLFNEDYCIQPVEPIVPIPDNADISDFLPDFPIDNNKSELEELEKCYTEVDVLATPSRLHRADIDSFSEVQLIQAANTIKANALGIDSFDVLADRSFLPEEIDALEFNVTPTHLSFGDYSSRWDMPDTKFAWDMILDNLEHSNVILYNDGEGLAFKVIFYAGTKYRY